MNEMENVDGSCVSSDPSSSFKGGLDQALQHDDRDVASSNVMLDQREGHDDSTPSSVMLDQREGCGDLAPSTTDTVQEIKNDAGPNGCATMTCSSDDNGITERLNRELALSKTHRLQLQGHWRRILSKERFQELHDGIPRLIQYHDENIVRKKEVIDALQREIHNLQDLFHDASVANMNRMEDLIAIHDDQVVKLDRDFRHQVSMLQSQFHVDIEKINMQYHNEKALIKQCIQSLTGKDERRIQALRQEHQHELEEIKNRNIEHVNSLRFIMDSKVEDLQEQFEQTHGEFAQNTDSAQAAYSQLRSKEEAMLREIESKTRQANKLQREIQRFQLIAKQEEAQINDRHQELLERKSRAIARWNNTQEEMAKFREEQQRKLLNLIRRANEQKEGLRRQCELADRVKKIALSCQKWESQREKFASLLRESSSPTMKDHPDEGGNEESEHIGVSEQKRLYIIDCMGQLGDRTHHFWNKYNMAKLDVITLNKKVRQLKSGQQDIEKKLKMYHDGITVNNDVLRDRNPLLVINGKMNSMPGNGIGRFRHGGKKRMMRRLTVVEGNHFIATNNKTQAA